MAKKLLIGLWLGLVLMGSAQAQSVNFSEHIAPIIYNKCAACHRQGEIAPMPFTNYNEVAAYATMIKYVTEIGYMPPWKPDHSYSTFRDEVHLSKDEIALIGEWVDNGAPQGDPKLEPPLPEFPTGSQLGTPDLVLPMAQAFRHTGNNADRYQIFVLPTGLTEARDLAAIEFRPGNKKIVHHSIIALDSTGKTRALDAATPDEYGYVGFGGFGADNVDMLGGWTPGNHPTYFPANLGKHIPVGSDIAVQMHYAPYASDEYDSSTVNLFFWKNPVTRRILTLPIISPGALKESFIIPPNEVKTFHGTQMIPIDVSLISVYPHMHLTGKSWEVYAVLPDGDTLPIIRIKDWDFNWQNHYRFKSLIKVPAGSILHAIAVYDNTADNPANPNSPPKQLQWGEGTHDEMYLVYSEFVFYEDGDEDMLTSVVDDNPYFTAAQNRLYPVAPNPCTGPEITVGFSMAKVETVTLELYDLQGRRVRNPLTEQPRPTGHHKVNLDITGLANGAYFLKMRTPSFGATQKLFIEQ